MAVIESSADFLLTVGVDPKLSLDAMQKGIAQLVIDLNNNPPKIKVDFDINKNTLTTLQNQINDICKKLDTTAAVKVTGGGSAQEIVKDTAATNANTKAKQANAAATAQKAQADANAAASRKSAKDQEMKSELSRQALLKKSYTLLTQMQNAESKWTAAKTGKSSSAYTAIQSDIALLQQWNMQFKSEQMTADEFSIKLQSLSSSFATNSNTIKAADEATQTWSERLGGLSSKFGTWFSITRVIMAAYRSVRQMISSVIELDTAMTELKKVTNETDETYEKFLSNASSRAQSLGASLSDIVSSTSDFARLGYSIEDAERLSDAAIVYKNVGDGIDDIGTASESIIATMQAFGVSADDVMCIVDKFNEVGNNYAISSKGVGDALLRSAAAMHAANNSLDETIALATAANTVTQDPEKVGTTLKTVSMYLRAAKTEAEDAGESTEGMAVSISKLRDEILSLTGNKVDIQIDEDTFKSTYQILKDLSVEWNDLTDVSKANILEMIGGKRNSNVVAALLENFETAEKVLGTSSNSANSALEENEKQLNSINGKISLFKASFESFSANTIDSEFIKSIIDIATWIMKGADWLSEWNALLPAIITSFISLKNQIGLFSTNGSNISFGLTNFIPGNKTELTNIISEFNNLGDSSAQSKFIEDLKESNTQLSAYLQTVKNGSATLKGYGSFLVGTSAKTVGLTIVTTALNTVISAGIGVLIGLVFTGVSKLIDDAITTTEEWNEKLSEVKQELSDLQTEADTLNSELETTHDRIRELKNQGSLTVVEQNELERLQAENAELERKILLNNIAQQQKNEERNNDFIGAVDKIAKNPSNVDSANEQSNSPIPIHTSGIGYYQDSNLTTLLSWKEKLEKANSEEETEYSIDFIKEKIEYWEEIAQNDYEELKAAVDNSGIEYIENPTTDIERQVNSYLDYINEFNDKYIFAVGTTEQITQLWENILNRPQYTEARNELQNLADTGELTADKIAELAANNDSIAELLSYLHKIGLIDLSNIVKDTNKDGIISADEIKNTKDFKGSLDGLPGMFNKVKESAEDTNAEVTSISKTFEELNDTADVFGTIRDAFTEIAESGQLAYSTISDIYEKFSELDGIEDSWLTEYINKLVSAKENVSEYNKILGEMAIKYAEVKLGSENLTKENQALITSMLSEQGVVNANEVAWKVIAQSKINAIASNKALTEMTEEEVKALVSEANSTIVTQQALSAYELAKKLANKTSLDTKESVQQLLIEANAAGLDAEQIATLERIKSLQEQIANTPKNSMTHRQNLLDSLEAEKQKMSTYTLKFDFTDITPNFKPSASSSSSSSSSPSSSSSSYTATEDPWLKKRQKEVDNAKHRLELGKTTEYLADEEIKTQKKLETKRKEAINLQKQIDALGNSKSDKKKKKSLNTQLDDINDDIKTLEKKIANSDSYYSALLKTYNKFPKKIKAKQNEVAKLQSKWNKMSKKQRKSDNGKKLKEDLQQAKDDLKDIKEQYADWEEELHSLELDAKKEEYDTYKETQIQAYLDGDISYKKLQTNLKAKLRELFKGFDKETYNSLIGELPDDLQEALKDKFELDSDFLDNQKSFDLITEEEYYKKKLALAESYYNQSEEFAEDYTDALVNMYEFAKDSYLEDLEKQKEALEDQKDAISDFYEKQRQLIQDNSDNEDYEKEQSEKRKTVNDLKTQIAELERDTSEKSKKRIAELQDELSDAENELSEFERQHALDQTIAMLEELEEKHLASIDEQIEALDKTIDSINNNTADIYKAVVAFAKEKYNITIDVSKIGLPTHASGTPSSAGGGAITQEQGSEAIAINKINGYTLLTPESMVWSNEQTKKLWELSKNPESLFKQYFKDTNNNSIPQINSVNNTKTDYNVILNEGAVIIQGDANKNLIKTAGKELAYEVLTQLKKYK